ncbi:MAG: NAD(P)/FAD-dependent oxidoreductase [Anaerolinea sp.]|nr:NAD(P)/FAD-dependent oxidoreductase [Anaerolinea sp.]
MSTYDAVIVGSGPNGLAAAITLAKTGRKVLVLEAKDTLGGGMRTMELTEPGYWHDVCSSVHPLGVASPFFHDLPLHEYGLEWVYPTAGLAHPMLDDTAVILEKSIPATAARLGPDEEAYRRLMEYLVHNQSAILNEFLAPIHFPRHPFVMASFGLKALQSGSGFARRTFQTEAARGMFAGLAAHAMMPLEKIATASFGLMLGMLLHGVGWALARGGSRSIGMAMARYLATMGGEIVTGMEVRSLADIPPAPLQLFDTSPRTLLQVVGDAFPAGYRHQLERYRYGMGVVKVDYALSEPIPWRARECALAGTVHLGSTLAKISASERAAFSGHQVDEPYTLVVQPTLFDSTRAPEGKHIGWAYCHVPNGSPNDYSPLIDAQIERYAPGFKDIIIGRRVHTAQQMEAYNANYVGGDINSGVQDLRQLFTRPTLQINPYRTPIKGVYICSSATPPGGGVHGMCGYHAAMTALRDIL